MEGRERYWLNESKVPQMRRALRQVFWNWYYNRSYCPKFEPKANAICRRGEGGRCIGTYVGDDRIVGNVLLMLGTMYDLKYFAEKDLTNTKMLIKTGLNEKAMKELTQFLEEEMYPILPYRVEVGEKKGCDVEPECGDSGEGCTGLGEKSTVVEFEPSFECLFDSCGVI